MKKWILIPALALLVCPAAHAKSAKATLTPTTDLTTAVATVTFDEIPGGVKMTADVTSAAPGAHGFHIHEIGACGDSGKAAGAHFNPAGAPHGKVAEAGVHGAHAGDFGNLEVGADGAGHLETEIPGLTLDNGDFGVLGRSMILHAKADQFTQPAGDAGDRIACGVISE